MPEDTPVRSELDRVLARFPEHEALARHLFLTHPAFRSACEDYRLACEGLATFQRLAAHAPRPELGDYRRLVVELEAELRAMLRAADGVAGSRDTGRPGVWRH
ncbi:hypothetical protein [Neoroseomonas rubea]|uniref:hypothetical protein n=1 Tax=Neoroseomonas rubea TaxID=2748666 RepID=UPI0018E00E1B|nr:hypothetical protein [Roseomonas rubea]